MGGDTKTWNYQIGPLHIVLYNRWQGFEYANVKGARGWSFMVGFIHFWGAKAV